MTENILLHITKLVCILGVLIIMVLICNIYLKRMYLEVEILVNSDDICSTNNDNKLSYKIVKRILDVIFSLVGIVALMPILLISYIICKVNNKTSPIITQNQIGKDKKIYKAYKFNIFKENCSENIDDKPNETNSTKVGLFLYRTAIADLPMLFNIVKGDVSVVGRSEYSSKMLELVPNDILNEKPGLVSLWVVSKDKQEFNFNSKIKYDIYYINNKSITLDMKIVLRCIIVAFGITGEY